MSKAPPRLARLLTAEAARAYGSLAGAVVVATAACVAGGDLAAVLALPEARGRPRSIVLPRAQVVELDGVSLLQLIRLAGGEAVEVGTVERCRAEDVETALVRDAVAGLYLRQPDRPAGILSLPAFVWACRAVRATALVVDVTGEGPLPALDAGAGMVLFDPARCRPEAPSLGIVAGSAAALAGCALQERGLGALFPVAAERAEAATAVIEAAAANLSLGLGVPTPPA